MKRSMLDNPDAFSLLPFLALLPSNRKVSELQKLAPAFHARLESVETLNDSLGDEESEQKKNVLAEYAMLKHVLDWMSTAQSQ